MVAREQWQTLIRRTLPTGASCLDLPFGFPHPDPRWRLLVSWRSEGQTLAGTGRPRLVQIVIDSELADQSPTGELALRFSRWLRQQVQVLELESTVRGDNLAVASWQFSPPSQALAGDAAEEIPPLSPATRP